MKVRELMASLQAWYDDEDEIIVAWWDKSFFTDYGDDTRTITDEQWHKIVERGEDMDTSDTNQYLDDVVDEVLEEETINNERGIL